MIQYDKDNPGETSGKSNSTVPTVSTTTPRSSGIVLCKWLPTLSSFSRLISKVDDEVESNAESGVNILQYDESVVIFPKDAAFDINNDNNDNQEEWRIDGLLRLLSEDEDEIDGINRNTGQCESWNLGETDPEFIHRLHSNDDRFRGRDNNLVSSHCYATIEKRSCFQYNGVAISLFSPSVTIQPLKSMVISIVGLATASQQQGDCDDTMSILMQAFWKRQLVGKVIAFEDRWTSRIKVTAGTDSNYGIRSTDERTDNDGNHRPEETAISGNVVYVVVESCTPLTIMARSPTAISTNEEYHKGTLYLPNNFYMALPSTYITIRPTSLQSSLQEYVGLDSDTTSSFRPTNIDRQSLLRPPTATASLLMDTLDCIRSLCVGNGDVPRTFLLSGPPGVGKTFSVSWAAKAHPATLLCSIRGSELLQGTTSGRSSPARALESEFLKMVERISLRERRKNEDGFAVAGLVFLDECDALVSVDSVATMLADLLDRVSRTRTSLSSKDGELNDVERYWKRIVVVGATNRIDSIPHYLRRAGRFDRELPMSPPSVQKRTELLSSLLTNLQSHFSSKEITHELDEAKKAEYTLPLQDELQEIAELCVGFVAADLSALVRKAWLISLQENNANNAITFSHLDSARNLVGASALRDASLAAPPKITWDDIAGDPGGAKTALRQAIEWPRLKAREFAILGLQPCRGILLHGPPGCAKTTLARAAAGSSGVAFLSLSPAQVYASSYVGEAERTVRQAFHLARSTAPCILFFDEIDSIFGSGSSSSSNNDSGSLGGNGRGSSAEARVLSTFLNEMDGVDIAAGGKDGVLVLGATNRPWTLDPALLRPGRLGDKIIFLPPPDKEARRSIFERQFSMAAAVNKSKANSEMSWDLDFSILVELSEWMTGAEIVGACQEAKIHWMREVILDPQLARGDSSNNDECQQQDCIVNALMSIKPLLSNPEALEEFQVFENREKKSFDR